MAITQQFDGRNITEVGAYGSFKSGESVTPSAPSFGRCLVIDNKHRNLVGSGVEGENFQGKRSLYQFNSKEAFQAFVRGGLLYDLANPLFDPQGIGTQNGVDSLSYISASKSVSSRIGLSFSGGVGGGAKATANLKAVTATIPTGLGGTGYAVADTITLTGGAFSTAIVLTVTSVALGAVTGVNITNAGVYTVAPTGNATQATTSGAGAGAQFSLLFGLNAVVISAGGTGYTIAPTVRFFSTTGTGAIATATLTSGAVTSVTIGTSGSGYTKVVNLFFVATGGNGGEFIFRTLVEGSSANGSESGGEITQGFGAVLSFGEVDSTKLVLTFYKGTFTGLDVDGIPYNGVLQSESAPEIIAVSDEFGSYDELLSWIDRSQDFKNWFIKESSVKYGTGAITSGDLTNNFGNILAVQGDEWFGQAYITKVLDSIVDADFDFILCLDYGATSDGAQSVTNTKIFEFLNKIKNKNLPQMYVGAGRNEKQFTITFGSVDTSKYYNSPAVSVVHSDIQIQGVRGMRYKDVLYHSALLLGTEARLAPQVPLTNKRISVKSAVHELSETQRLVALQNGVLHIKMKNNAWVVAQGVNSMGEPKNKQMIADDGTSFEKSMRRIDGAMMKEIRANADALGFAGGGNRNIASPEKIKDFAEGYLQSRVATPTIDNLILNFRKVNVTFQEDCNILTFEHINNSPINKLFFEGKKKLSFQELTVSI